MPTLSPEEARQALAEIDSASRLMRQAVRGSVLSSVLMLWGVVWFAIFIWSYLIFPRGDRVAWTLNGIGFLGTAFLVASQGRRVRSEVSRRLVQQVALFQAVLIAYAFALPFLVPQVSWMHRLALILGMVMLGYVVLGLWLREAVLIVLGLGITAVVLACRAWLSPPHFLLGLGLLGGGALFAGGLVVRLRWK
jgi:hypothetical protein